MVLTGVIFPKRAPKNASQGLFPGCQIVPLLPTSSRLLAFCFCAVCVLGKKNIGANAPSEAGVGLFASRGSLLNSSTENFRALPRESSFTPMPISDLSGAVFGNITQPAV